MKKFYLHLLFIFIGIGLALWSFIFAYPQILNIKDTYFVISPQVFSIFVLAFYTIFAATYFITRKYSNYLFGLLNIFFITLPIIYFIYSNSQEDQITEISYYITHQSEMAWKTVYIPNAFKIFFSIGIFMLLLNIILSIAKFKKPGKSASS